MFAWKTNAGVAVIPKCYPDRIWPSLFLSCPPVIAARSQNSLMIIAVSALFLMLNISRRRQLESFLRAS